jgi:signal peptidase I
VTSRDRLSGWLWENRRFLALLFLLFVFRTSFADHYLVPSGSMEYTLVPGDRVLVDKRAYGLRVPFTEIKLTAGARPARGEIVVFDEPDSGTRLIKRVVAVGGDAVELRDGRLFVDGHPVTEQRLNLQSGGGPDIPLLHVPQGQVLVLGDARGNSRDSRWFGLVAESALYARAYRVYWRAGEGPVWLAL